MYAFTGCYSLKEEEDKISKSIDLNEQRKVTQDKVLIVTGEYIPYVGEKLEDHGFLSIMIEHALQECNMDYVIEFYPWARCIEMVQRGEAWAAYPFGFTEDKEQEYLFSDPIYQSVHRFYYLKDNDKIKNEVNDFDSIKDFTDYTFGGAYGYWYGDRNDFTSYGVKSEWANDTKALLKMLNAKRIDFFIEDELVFDTVVNEVYPGQEDKFIALPNEAKNQNYHLLVSKTYPNSAALLDQFNIALKNIEIKE
jgi:polar amino acid transport system substrate-binding protein